MYSSATFASTSNKYATWKKCMNSSNWFIKIDSKGNIIKLHPFSSSVFINEWNLQYTAMMETTQISIVQCPVKIKADSSLYFQYIIITINTGRYAVICFILSFKIALMWCCMTLVLLRWVRYLNASQIQLQIRENQSLLVSIVMLMDKARLWAKR